MVSRTNKFRGTRTHGRGKKSGRGGGKHGGIGNAGLHKHKSMLMLKYMPDHFGRHGFKRPQKVVSAKITMNVCDLEHKLETMLKDGFAVKEGKKIKLDLTKMGVDKLLGSGQIKTAKQKVEEAGGHILQPQ